MNAVPYGFKAAKTLGMVPMQSDQSRLLNGIEEIMKSGVSGELRAIARREYLNRTNPAPENDNER